MYYSENACVYVFDQISTVREMRMGLSLNVESMDREKEMRISGID